MNRRRFKFADGKLGEALDDLFAAGDGLDRETDGRIAMICRLFEQMLGSDFIHDIAHAELDELERVPGLAAPALQLRRLLLPRKLPPGAFDRTAV